MLFGELWDMMGCEPGEMSFTYTGLGELLSRDRTTIRDMLAKLHQFWDLLDVSKPKKGPMVLRLFRPLPGHATAKPDPQRLLPGFDEDRQDQRQPLPTGGNPPAAPRDRGKSPGPLQSGGNPPANAQDTTRVALLTLILTLIQTTKTKKGL